MYEPFATYSQGEPSSEYRRGLDERRQPLKTLQTIIFNEDVPATPNSIYSAKDFNPVQSRHQPVLKHTPAPRRPSETHTSDEDSQENRRPIEPSQRLLDLPGSQMYTEGYEAVTPVKPQVVVKSALRSHSNSEHKQKQKTTRDVFLAKYRKSSIQEKSASKQTRVASRHSSKGSFSAEIKLQTYEKLVNLLAVHCRQCPEMKRLLGEAGLSHILREAKW